MSTQISLETVRTVLTELSFAPKTRGYKLLCPGFVRYVQENKMLTGQELYLWLGQQFGDLSERNVHQNIEYSIKDAWENGNREKWKQYFPGYSKAPANMDFIATLAEHLQKREEEQR